MVAALEKKSDGKGGGDVSGETQTGEEGH